jgi:hypothetical protein
MLESRPHFISYLVVLRSLIVQVREVAMFAVRVLQKYTAPMSSCSERTECAAAVPLLLEEVMV